MASRRDVMVWALALAVMILAVVQVVTAAGGGAQAVGEKLLLDNDRVAVYEFTFPPGFRGDEHSAVANEFAYVLDGEFAVVTKGKGERVVRRGELEYAAGPVLVTADEIPDPQTLAISLRVNGEVRQSSHTSKMIFPVDECIAVLSQGFTLLAGDVIAPGTPEGVGAALGKFLKAGDTIEAEVEKIGVLANRVVAP